MTIEDRILANSSLPKNGTHTILEHMFAVGDSVFYGVVTQVEVEDVEDVVIVTNITEHIEIEE